MTSNAFILLISSATTSLVPGRATADKISVGQGESVYRSVESARENIVSSIRQDVVGSISLFYG